MTNVLTLIEISSTGELTNTVPASLAAAAKLRTPVGGTDPISELRSLGPEQIYVAEREQVGALLATPQQLADALDAAVGAPGGSGRRVCSAVLAGRPVVGVAHRGVRP